MAWRQDGAGQFFDGGRFSNYLVIMEFTTPPPGLASWMICLGCLLWIANGTANLIKAMRGPEAHPPNESLAKSNKDMADRMHILEQDGKISGGPHSATGWVNMIGVPAVVVPGGFYPTGLPFGLEISTRLWRDGDLLGWAYAYEQATHHRRPPVLVEKGLLPDAR